MLQVRDVPATAIADLLSRLGLELVIESDDRPVSGSFWGDSEAGIIAHKVFVRADTPIHSLLHEACHTICMDEQRRAGLSRDAGGDDLEEAAVCFLQVLLADYLPGVGRQRLMRDMDTWGYSFRLGRTALWFATDADDALEWLRSNGLVDNAGMPTFKLRSS